jgi:formylglycine-generating enzyme required for sulfatase activity
MHTENIEQLIKFAIEKVEAARLVIRQTPETIGQMPIKTIENALAFTEDALRGDEQALRGNVSAAYSRLWRNRVPTDEHQRLYVALADLRDCLIEIEQAAAAANYLASEGSIPVPTQYLVPRLSIGSELNVLEMELNELDERLKELSAQKEYTNYSSFQDAVIEEVTVQASAKSEMAHILASESQVDIKGLAHIVEGIARIIEAFQHTVAPVKARVSSAVKVIARGLSAVASLVVQASAAVVRRASRPEPPSNGFIEFSVRDGDGDRTERTNAGGDNSFRDCWLRDSNPVCGPEMVLVPAGRFLMGSPKGQGEANEYPQHEVVIPQAFAVGKYPVTFDDWEIAFSDGGVSYRPESDFGGGRRPITRVSWNDAQAYVRWLGRKTGKLYRLLSESEWEYSCRASTVTAYSFGDTISRDQARFSQSQSGRAGGPTEVGTFPPNAFGLFDMHGNVLEWCEDAWHDDYRGKPDSLKITAAAWTTGDASRRVLRGGSWYGRAKYLRSASRSRDTANSRGDYLGFRLARDLSR